MLENTANINIKTEYNRGQRDFSKLQLRRIDLKNTNLRGINLQGSDLSYTDLKDADLSGANLSNCYFNGANLTGANLSDANLKGAYLIKAYLTRANFKRAILKDAYFTDSFLTNSILTKADFSKADLSGTFLNGVHFDGAIFKDATYDNTTRFDQCFDPVSLGMIIISSFQKTATNKVSIEDMVTNFETIVAITSRYLGGTITAKNFEESRPDIEWLQEFSIDKKGEIGFSGNRKHQLTTMQLKWFEKWTNAFIKKCSIIIQDLPSILEEKHLTVDYLIKNTTT
jgi:uncharacterized protein YjbI with pentapeptide repeats